MKKQNNFLLLSQLALMIFFSVSPALPTVAHSRETHKNEGYWVVESNAVTKDFTILKFYNENNQLIYEEKIEGVSLDITSKKNKRMLNHTLKMIQHNTLVAGQIKGYSSLAASSIFKKRQHN